MGIRPSGYACCRACGRRCHVECGRGDLLGVVGFGFDAEDCIVDVLELLGECQLNQEGGRSRV